MILALLKFGFVGAPWEALGEAVERALAAIGAGTAVALALALLVLLAEALRRRLRAAGPVRHPARRRSPKRHREACR